MQPCHTECASTREKCHLNSSGHFSSCRQKEPAYADFDQSRDEKREPTLTKTAAIAATTRELIIQLSRGNADPAHALARVVQAELNMILSSDLDASSTLRRQARQTMFAIEEVLVLVDQSDLRGASEAARDAAREWRTIAQTQE